MEGARHRGRQLRQPHRDHGRPLPRLLRRLSLELRLPVGGATRHVCQRASPNPNPNPTSTPTPTLTPTPTPTLALALTLTRYVNEEWFGLFAIAQPQCQAGYTYYGYTYYGYTYYGA